MSTVKRPFGVVNGGRWDSFPSKPSTADTAVVDGKFIPTEEQLIATQNAPKRHRLDIPLVAQIMAKYQDVQKSSDNSLAVLWGEQEQRPVFITAVNEEQLMNVISQDHPWIYNGDAHKRYSRYVFIFEDTNLPFHDHIPENRMPEITTWEDLERVITDIQEEAYFNDPYGSLPQLQPDSRADLAALVPVEKEEISPDTIGGDWQVSANPDSPYSEKIKSIHKIFDEQRQSAIYNNLYIALLDDNTLTYFVMSDAYNIEDANRILGNLKTGKTLIISLDTSRNFDDQIRSGNFDPEKLVSWEALRETPHDCLTATKLLEQHLEDAPITLGPKKPTLAWDNPKP